MWKKTIWFMTITPLLFSARSQLRGNYGFASWSDDSSLVPNCGFPSLQVAVPYSAVELDHALLDSLKRGQV
jgi:hypothetical protein